jgi:hypothetical protein
LNDKNINAAVTHIQNVLPTLDITWINTKRVATDWKVKVFEHNRSGLRFGIYRRETLNLLLEHSVGEIDGAILQEKRPVSHAMNADQKFKSIPGAYYQIDTQVTLENMIRKYLAS